MPEDCIGDYARGGNQSPGGRWVLTEEQIQDAIMMDSISAARQKALEREQEQIREQCRHLPPHHRYHQDAGFAYLVNFLADAMGKAGHTPADVSEALMLAIVKNEERKRS